MSGELVARLRFTAYVAVAVGLVVAASSVAFPTPTRPLVDVSFQNVGEYPNGPRIDCQTRDNAALSVVDFKNLRLEVHGTVDPHNQKGEPSEHWDYLPEYWKPHPTRPGQAVRDETGHTFHSNRAGNQTPIGFQLDQVVFWNLQGESGVHGYTFKVVTDSGTEFVGECFFTVSAP